MRRYYYLFLIVGSLLLLGSCDITKLLGSEEDDKDGAEVAAASVAKIESFTFHAADNPDLDDDYTTLVADSGVITAFLPATVVASGAELEARVTLSEGAKISPNPQIARPYTSPVTFTVTSFDKSETIEYQVRPQSREAAVGAQITSFLLDSGHAENTELRSDISAEVSGTTVFVQLPYQLMQQDSLLLEPSLSISDGAIVTPTGPQDFKTDLSYTVTGADGSATIYAVDTAVDPNTMTFLDLSDPFYVDASNVRTAFTIDDLITSTNARTVSVQPSVWDVIDGRKVGFFDYSGPYNGTVNFEPVVLGETPPYTITVTSANGEWSQDYTIDLDRVTPSATGLKGARMYVRTYWDRLRTRVALSARKYRYGDSVSNGWMSWDHNNDQTYLTPIFGSGGLGTFHNAAGWVGNKTDWISRLSEENWVDISNPVLWRHAVDSPTDADAPSSYTTSHSSYLQHPRDFGSYVTDWELSKTYEYTMHNPSSELISYEVTADDYAWFENVLEGPLSEGFSITDSGVNKVLTVDVVTQESPPVVGQVATFDIVAESGDRQTYSININN